MKRMFDVVTALLALLLLSPFLLLLAIVLLFKDGFPLFFRQNRVGRDGREFVLLKFRTMRPVDGAEHGSFDAGDSSRVTPLGAVLRRSKLDELPQLVNVLRGDMSLVGPRPEVRKWVDTYPERWARVLKVRPGITDPASIVYRDEEMLLARSPDPEVAYRETVLPHKLGLYEEYIDNQSFLGDLRLIFCTIQTLFR